MVKCKNCGAEVMEGTSFCTDCGAPLVDPFEEKIEHPENPFEQMEQNVPTPESVTPAWTAGGQFEQPNQGQTFGADGQWGENQNWNSAGAEGQWSESQNWNNAGAEGQWGQNPVYGENQQWNQQYGGANYLNPNDKLWGALSYLFIVIWIVAYIVGKQNGARSPYLTQHLNQSLIVNLCSIFAGWLGGTIGAILALVALVFAIMGVVSAVKGEMKELPLIGQFKIIK